MFCLGFVYIQKFSSMQFEDDISVYRLEGKKATVQANPRPHSYYQISVRADRRSRAVEIGRTASGRNCTGSDPSHDRHVPWAVACGADTVRARRLERQRSNGRMRHARPLALHARLPSSRRALYVPCPLLFGMGIHSCDLLALQDPAVRAVLPCYLRLLTVYSVGPEMTRSVSVLELRALFAI